MKKIINKLKQTYKKETPLKIEWIVAGFIAFIMFIMFYYTDFRSVTIWSTNIWDCLADGDISQYYVYTGLNIYNLPHQYVSGPLFNVIFWAIWNIPIWICQRFFGLTIIENAFLLMWSKLFLVLALTVTLVVTYKICELLFKDNKKSKWITYLAATFIFTYIEVFYAGQTNILICMFSVLGIYFLMKDKNILFYIFSALAISVKYFYLIPYIPIILLTEKKIWKIICKIGITSLPILIFRLIAGNFPMYNSPEQSSSLSNNIFNGLLDSGIVVGNGEKVPFFVLGMIIVCFIAYMIKPKTKEIRNNYIIYFSVVPFMLMFMFSTYYEFYRVVLLMPMLMILYGFKPELFRINVILDTVMSAFLFFLLLTNSSYFFATEHSMNGTIITDILKIEEAKSVSLYYYLGELFGNNLELIQSFAMTIAFAILAIMIVINYPGLNIKKDERKNPDKPERWIIWARTLLVVPILIILLITIK